MDSPASSIEAAKIDKKYPLKNLLPINV